MARRGGKLEGEAAEMGRHVGTLERIGYKELVEELRVQAKAEGKTLTDKMAEVLKAGLYYEKYKDLTLADAMKVLDFIERAFNNFLYPVMYTSGQFMHEMQIEKIQKMAQAMGFIPREYAERLAEQKASQALQQLAREIEQEQSSPRETGPVSKFIDKLSEVLAERVGEEAIRRLVETGRLDEFLDALGETAINATRKVLGEELQREG